MGQCMKENIPNTKLNSCVFGTSSPSNCIKNECSDFFLHDGTQNRFENSIAAFHFVSEFSHCHWQGPHCKACDSLRLIGPNFLISCENIIRQIPALGTKVYWIIRKNKPSKKENLMNTKRWTVLCSSRPIIPASSSNWNTVKRSLRMTVHYQNGKDLGLKLVLRKVFTKEARSFNGSMKTSIIQDKHRISNLAKMITSQSEQFMMNPTLRKL